MRLDILRTRDGLPCQRDQDIPDDNSGFVGRSICLDFENDDRSLLGVLQGLPQIIRETYRLQSHAEIPARNTAFFQQGFSNAIDSGRRDSNGTEPRKARRCDSEDFAVRVNYGSANGRGLQAAIQPEVWGTQGTSPGTAYRDDKAHNSKRSHGTASARPPHDQSDATWLNCRGRSKLHRATAYLRAFQ